MSAPKPMPVLVAAKPSAAQGGTRAMFGRTKMMLVGLAAAVGVPYAVSSTGVTKTISSSDEAAPAVAVTATKETSSSFQIPFLSSSEETKPARISDVPALPFDPRIAGDPVQNLGEIFNFHVTTGWVMGRWPRVSTRLGEIDLQGYRVPLVSGTAYDDVAGALTYYFNKEQKVERITFFGTTGDPQKLIAAVQQLGLSQVIHPDAGLMLYQHMWNGQVESELQVRPAKVVRSGSPHERYSVALVLVRPSKLK
ncbi:MAG: hypothetical protein KF708_05895 [Pirellulales bacterium]|nr:hypothetical protein [Pirellulales bacterium]